MNKHEATECAKLNAYFSAAPNADTIAMMARSLSAMIRAARTAKSRNALLTFAAGFVGVVQHSDFVVA